MDVLFSVFFFLWLLFANREHTGKGGLLTILQRKRGWTTGSEVTKRFTEGRNDKEKQRRDFADIFL
jgi:hypothetical protein